MRETRRRDVLRGAAAIAAADAVGLVLGASSALAQERDQACRLAPLPSERPNDLALWITRVDASGNQGTSGSWQRSVERLANFVNHLWAAAYRSDQSTYLLVGAPQTAAFYQTDSALTNSRALPAGSVRSESHVLQELWRVDGAAADAPSSDEALSSRIRIEMVQVPYDAQAAFWNLYASGWLRAFEEAEGGISARVYATMNGSPAFAILYEFVSAEHERAFVDVQGSRLATGAEPDAGALTPLSGWPVALNRLASATHLDV